MPIMIWIAIAIFAGVQSWPDMGILIAIQLINATLGWCARVCVLVWGGGGSLCCLVLRRSISSVTRG